MAGKDLMGFLRRPPRFFLRSLCGLLPGSVSNMCLGRGSPLSSRPSSMDVHHATPPNDNRAKSPPAHPAIFSTNGKLRIPIP
mmetsp:Transcript_5461/g.9111  ORF Transcript_5461/g.9111 Transcript_5461/m.9111 type:complete len:82 (+) Transcript_5461:87-332(+)